jgi:predicted TIM-barrel fold metal-dependent hydrolase
VEIDLSGVPVFDGHAHNLLLPTWLKEYPFEGIFTESDNHEYIKFLSHETLSFKRSMLDISKILECPSEVEEIKKRRNSMSQSDLTSLYFKEANISSIVLDDGLCSSRTRSVEWHGKFVDVHRALRIENLAESIIAESTSFDSFLSDFRDALLSTSENVVAYKSIIAYRSGLSIRRVDKETAREGYMIEREKTSARIVDKRLLDFLFHLALEISSARMIPFQIHTGWGDRDLSLIDSNPLLLKSVLEDEKVSRAKVVLLHCYPYPREGAYLAAIYPNVFVDFGLSVPLLSIKGMEFTISSMLEIAPVTRVCYSSDARFLPEGFYLAALWARRILGRVLWNSVEQGEISLEESYRVAERVLEGNSRSLYLGY